MDPPPFRPSSVVQETELPPLSSSIHNNNNSSLTLDSTLSYPVTNSSSSSQEEEFSSLAKNGSKGRLVKVLVLGLLLYLLDVGLHLAIAGKYLAMRDCHPGVERVMVDFNLGEVMKADRSDFCPMTLFLLLIMLDHFCAYYLFI